MKRIINIKATNGEIEEICDAISKMDIDCSIESKVSYSKDEIINILRISTISCLYKVMIFKCDN